MPHRDERLPKTEEARVMSHDPLIPDDTEEDTPMFTAQEVLAADAAAKHEADEHYDPTGERGRDTEANAENSAEEDESPKVANDPEAGAEAKAQRGEDEDDEAEKPKRRSRKSK